MQTYKIDLSYKGTNYFGFQKQKDKNTIQKEFESAINIFTKNYEMSYSGRTDAGVHAKSQIISLKTDIEIDKKMQNSIDKLLGQDISINSLIKTKKDFHARFDARKRTYKYFLSDSTKKLPFLNDFTHSITYKVDVDELNKISNIFVGTHNFSSFAKIEAAKNPIRTIYKSQWRKNRDYFEYTIVGNAFLRNMVRNLVGVQLAVVNGKVDIKIVKDAIKNENSKRLNYLAPAKGLVLWNVKY